MNARKRSKNLAGWELFRRLTRFCGFRAQSSDGLRILWTQCVLALLSRCKLLRRCINVTTNGALSH